MKPTGLDVARSLVGPGAQPPMAATLGIVVVEVDEGRAVVVGTPDARSYNPLGTVHGGYAATMLDSACAVAALTRLGADQGFTTMEIKVAYHRPITADVGEIRATAEVISMGRRAAYAQGTIVDGTGRLLASATSTILVTDTALSQ